jgi:magnesium-protoporphyrin IX monomethyl ester (oxidative) cyclase
MRANPHVLTGLNKYWVRFFLLAVFATMYVRDHARPAFHTALQIDPAEYGFKVFRLTTEISRQVFPITLDLDNPKFKAGLDRLLMINDKVLAAVAQGGIIGRVKKTAYTAAAAATFLRLYLLTPKANALPERTSMVPAW